MESRTFSSAESVSSCVELLADFGDRALQPSYGPWSNVDFHDRAKIHADLTKAYKDVRVVAKCEMNADVPLYSGKPGKFLPQRKRPAQRPRIDLSKTSKALAAKVCASKPRHSGAGASGQAC